MTARTEQASVVRLSRCLLLAVEAHARSSRSWWLILIRDVIMQQLSRRNVGALAIGLCLIAQPLLVATAPAQQPKPNILFILADNIGYGDLGIYGGGELRGALTPRIDQLAAEGLRLTQFLVEPACTPSRAALMTGRYSIRSGLSLVAVEGTSISLPVREITMAEMLRDAGYATAILGKWHLGAELYS